MCPMNIYILNFNFLLCSVPEMYTPPPIPLHIKTCSTRHKTNILHFYLLVSDEAVLEILSLHLFFTLNFMEIVKIPSFAIIIVNDQNVYVFSYLLFSIF